MQNPDTTPDPTVDEIDQAGDETTPAEASKFPVPKGNSGSGRFSFYDTTLGRYVGGVHDKKGDASKAGKGAASGEVVEV